MIKLFNKNRIISIIILAIFISTIVSGCSSKKDIENEPSIEEIHNKIEESIDISKMKQGDEEKLQKLYDIDIDIDEIEDFILYTPSSNIKANELLVLKVKDEKYLKNIKEKILSRVEVQSDNFKDYLPEEYYLIEKHLLKTKGNYVLFVISEDREKIEDMFEEFFK